MPRCWIVCAVLKKLKKEKKNPLHVECETDYKLLVHSSKPMMMNFLNRCVLIHARTHAYMLIHMLDVFVYACVFLYV